METQLLEGRRINGSVSAAMVVDGRRYLNFGGCTYLALGDAPAVRAAASQALSAGAAFALQLSPSYGPRSDYFDAVEKACADYCGTEASVYFASGYLIGMVVIASAASIEGPIFLDAGAHYSLADAAKVSERRTIVFAHCSADALQEAVRDNLRPGERPLVLTDGAFATTGRLPPLSDYAKVLEPYGGRLLVDEAHSFGTIGEMGRGVAEHFGVERITIGAGTLSKAFCTLGGFFAGDEPEVSRLRAVTPLRGANSGSPIAAAAAAAALRMMIDDPSRRLQIQSMTQRLRSGLRSLGLEVESSPAPIVAFRTGTRRDMIALQRHLFDQGIYLMLSNYLGAGPDGVFRAAVFADHTREDIDRLIGEVRQAV